jgi:DNA-directed RNA polymerase specialized sigma24 family protein
MQSYAMMMLVRTWNSFNPEKSNNPFAFFTQCIKHSFIQYLNQEKKQRTIRDDLLVDQGMNPSFGYNDNGSDHTVPGIEDEQDFDANLAEAAYLRRLQATNAMPIMRNDLGEEILLPSDDTPI